STRLRVPVLRRRRGAGAPSSSEPSGSMTSGWGLRWLSARRGLPSPSTTGPVPVLPTMTSMVSLVRGVDGVPPVRSGVLRPGGGVLLGDVCRVRLRGERRVEELGERLVDVALARDVTGLDEDRAHDLEHS